MDKDTYDVVVVGAGPAGATAAKITKSYNPSKDVALIKQDTGPSIHCPGFVSSKMALNFGSTPPEDIISHPVSSLEIISENSFNTVELPDGDDFQTNSIGWSIDSNDVVDWMVGEAEADGVDVIEVVEVYNISEDGSRSSNYLIECDDVGDVNFKSDIVGIATGNQWKLARNAGVDGVPEESYDTRKLSVVQFRTDGSSYYANGGYEKATIVLNNEYAPDGYIWCLPTDEDDVQWGICSYSKNEPTISKRLKDFLHTEKGIDVDIEDVERKTFSIQTGAPLENTTHEDLALIGPTAFQSDPMHISTNTYSVIAGECFARAVSRDDVGLYDEIWKDELLPSIQKKQVFMDILTSLDTEQQDSVVSASRGYTVDDGDADIELPRLLWHCIKSDNCVFGQDSVSAIRSAVGR